MPQQRHYFFNTEKSPRIANVWDLISFFLIIAVIVMFALAAKEMAAPYLIGEPLPISLDPSFLPSYAARTVLRMIIAMGFSLLFTFTIGTWAAKSRRAEQIIIPFIDILQSVPILSFLSITIVGFITLFPGSLLGPECCSIFVIFTSQAWNMALGFYQSLRTVPHDLKEAAEMFHLSAWQRFWRVDVPFSMPSLLWNSMMSMSASWFFVVLSEAISVSNQDIRLPGIGSYIQLAIDKADMQAVMYAIITMLIVILLYDQLVFRPLIAWSDKFKSEQSPGERVSGSWLFNVLKKTYLLRYFAQLFAVVTDTFVNLFLSKRRSYKPLSLRKPWLVTSTSWLWTLLICAAFISSTVILFQFITTSITFEEIWHVFTLGLATALRVMILIVVSSLIWVPIGVWIGLRPQAAQVAQPIIQFFASFPANLLYPLVVIVIVRYHLNVEIWLTPLMILGTQWYILFNVIAGAMAIPNDLYHAANNFSVSGWQWWKKLILPGIFPYYITGAITAAGGAWNASIVAEWVSWGDTTLRATGLGEYIHAYTNAGDFPRIVLGTSVMCLFVLTFNRLLWKPLYRLAESRFRLE